MLNNKRSKKIEDSHKNRKVMRFIFSVILYVGLSNSIFAQLDTINIQPHNSSKTETLITKTIFKDEKMVKTKSKKKKGKYTIDNKQTNKAHYNRINQQSMTIDDCKPCWLRYLDEAGKLLQEGFSYSDCALGERIEYYSSGKIKVSRFYKTNNTNDWVNFPCSVADGSWTYYDENGKIERIEIYKDGNKIQ
jgi:antitoxin component YwqK of YwqJK toxin-antitoxin module